MSARSARYREAGDHFGPRAKVTKNIRIRQFMAELLEIQLGFSIHIMAIDAERLDEQSNLRLE